MSNEEIKHKSAETVEEIEIALTRTEQFFEKNQKAILIAFVVVLVVVGGVWLFIKNAESQNQKALAQMFVAEQYFEQDSFKLALNGDGNYPGFLEIIEKYGSTRASDLAKYYSGVSYLNLGQYDDAIKYLEDADINDIVVASIKLGAIGDAYIEKGETEKAINYYLKASDKNPNDFSTPIYLFKAGTAYENIGKFDLALGVYEKIKLNYAESNEGRKIEKYIARVKAKTNKS